MSQFESAQRRAYRELFAHLPFKWFKETRLTQDGPFHSLVWSLAGAIATVQVSIEAAKAQAIPSTSSGAWLSFHLLGIGLNRLANETDEQAKERYQLEFSHTRNTREGLLRMLEFYAGLVAPNVRLETDFADGRFGALRAVLDSPDTDWEKLSFDWLPRLSQEYVANGIQVGVDVELRCFRSIPFPAYQFSTPFPAAWGQLGPLYERPMFVDHRRLTISRNQLAFVLPADWISQDPKLGEIHAQINEGPGSRYQYLRNGSKQGACHPYIDISYLPVLPTGGTAPETTSRPIRVSGFQFGHLFPRNGNQTFVRANEVEIRTNGKEPLGMLPAAGSSISIELPVDPVTALPYLPTPSSLDLVSLDYFSASLSGVNKPGDLFGQLRSFPKQAETIILPANEEVQIPDFAILSFQYEESEIVSSGHYWRIRGIPQSTRFFGEIRLDGNSDEFPFGAWEFQSDWFPRTPDDTQQYQEPTEKVPGDIGYIPNAIAGFTDFQVLEFLEVTDQVLLGERVRNELDLMAAGPWQLRLGAGDPRWGEIAPNGKTPIIAPFETLKPSAMWWENPTNGERRGSADVQAEALDLCIEFWYAETTLTVRPIREIELLIGHPQENVPSYFLPNPESVEIPVSSTLPSTNVKLVLPTSGDILQFPVLDVVDYQRMNAPVSLGVNIGFMYKIRAERGVQQSIGVSDETTLLSAFRAGQSRTSEPLRDRDYDSSL